MPCVYCGKLTHELNLQITNEEYTCDGEITPNCSTLTITPNPLTGLTFNNVWPEPSAGSSAGQTDDSVPLEKLIKTENLAKATASEEDKIKAVMFQSSLCYYSELDAMKLVGLPPPNYLREHHAQNWPQNRDVRFHAHGHTQRGRAAPHSLIQVDDCSRRHVIHRTKEEAYGIKRTKNPPFICQTVSSSSSEEEGPVPDALMCLICKNLMTDGSIIPCCRNSFCDKCIRTCLLMSDERVCPVCKQSHVPPDALTASLFIQQEVNRFKKRAERSRFNQPRRRPYSRSSCSSSSPSCSHRSRTHTSEPSDCHLQPPLKRLSERCRSEPPLYSSHCVSRKRQPVSQMDRD